MAINTYSRKTGVPLYGDVGEKVIRTTRFASIGAGTSGTIAIPGYAEIIENDFGGTVDAVVSGITSGKPNFTNALTAGGAVVSATFDTNGNYTLSGTPAAYPVALIYRVNTSLENFDSDSADIIGIPTVASSSGVAWGDITGTLADQTELQTVLNALDDQTVHFLFMGAGD